MLKYCEDMEQFLSEITVLGSNDWNLKFITD
jgi:hypothetical protein